MSSPWPQSRDVLDAHGNFDWGYVPFSGEFANMLIEHLVAPVICEEWLVPKSQQVAWHLTEVMSMRQGHSSILLRESASPHSWPRPSPVMPQVDLRTLSASTIQSYGQPESGYSSMASTPASHIQLQSPNRYSYNGTSSRDEYASQGEGWNRGGQPGADVVEVFDDNTVWQGAQTGWRSYEVCQTGACKLRYAKRSIGPHRMRCDGILREQIDERSVCCQYRTRGCDYKQGRIFLLRTHEKTCKDITEEEHTSGTFLCRRCAGVFWSTSTRTTHEAKLQCRPIGGSDIKE